MILLERIQEAVMKKKCCRWQGRAVSTRAPARAEAAWRTEPAQRDALTATHRDEHEAAVEGNKVDRHADERAPQPAEVARQGHEKPACCARCVRSGEQAQQQQQQQQQARETISAKRSMRRSLRAPRLQGRARVRPGFSRPCAHNPPCRGARNGNPHAPDVEATMLRSRFRTGPRERLLLSDESELVEPLRRNGSGSLGVCGTLVVRTGSGSATHGAGFANDLRMDSTMSCAE